MQNNIYFNRISLKSKLSPRLNLQNTPFKQIDFKNITLTACIIYRENNGRRKGKPSKQRDNFTIRSDKL